MTATKLKEKPILFSTSMVSAILDGRKVQTRRQIKLPNWATTWDDFETDGKTAQVVCQKTGCLGDIICPYSADVLWVRETWCQAESDTHQCYAYKADRTYRCGKPMPEDEYSSSPWKPSIHMPRAVSRITLQITNIRVERLQDITEQDAIAEGIEPREEVFDKDREEWVPTWCNYQAYDSQELGYYDPRGSFQSLWKSINGASNWWSNPWCWVIEFKKLI